MKRFFRYIRRFFELPWKEKLFFCEAVFFLLTAKLMLLALPFRICVKTIAPHNCSEQPTIDVLKQVKSAIARANRLSFWKNVCLVQSFAARWMLQRRKINSTLSIGIKKDPEMKISAHAWLMAGNFYIVSGAKDFQIIMNY